MNQASTTKDATLHLTKARRRRTVSVTCDTFGVDHVALAPAPRAGHHLRHAPVVVTDLLGHGDARGTTEEVASCS